MHLLLERRSAAAGMPRVGGCNPVGSGARAVVLVQRWSADRVKGHPTVRAIYLAINQDELAELSRQLDPRAGWQILLYVPRRKAPLASSVYPFAL
jgi:hypothetical protein